MGKHEVGYPRIERDFYPTPCWVVAALLEHVSVAGKHILEPACGDGRISEALKGAGALVYSTDIEDRGYAGLNGLIDFTLSTRQEFFWDAASIGANGGEFDGIITNPPLGKRGKLAEAFIEASLRCMGAGFMALLLPADFDSAKTRAHLFGDCPQFAGKIVLTRRIKWFDIPGNNKQPKENSAWFLWSDNAHAPILRYAPTPRRLRQDGDGGE